MNWACNSKNMFGPTPCDPGEGSKGQISLNYIFYNKVSFKDFYVFFQIKYIKHIKKGFLFWCLGHASGVELRGAGCAKRWGGGQFFSKMIM